MNPSRCQVLLKFGYGNDSLASYIEWPAVGHLPIIIEREESLASLEIPAGSLVCYLRLA
jgi:hypothetical protein